jgi:hypothetical protein
MNNFECSKNGNSCYGCAYGLDEGGGLMTSAELLLQRKTLNFKEKFSFLSQNQFTVAKSS